MNYPYNIGCCNNYGNSNNTKNVLVAMSQNQQQQHKIMTAYEEAMNVTVRNVMSHK